MARNPGLRKVFLPGASGKGYRKGCEQAQPTENIAIGGVESDSSLPGSDLSDFYCLHEQACFISKGSVGIDGS